MLAAVLETAVDPIITIDENGIMQSVNPATERLFGYQLDEMLGHDISILMDEPHREAHGRYIADYLRTSKKKIIGIGREVEARRKDGSIFPMHLSVSEFTQDGKRFFAGVIHDLTARKVAEEQLRQSERRLGLVLDASADGWWDYLFDDQLLDWSDGVYHVLGLNPEEIQPNLEFELELTHPEDRDVRSRVLDAHLQLDRPYRAEFRMRHKSGDYIWVRALGKAVRDSSGRPVRMTGTITDISDVMDKEEQLARAARLETIGQLTGGIAHDFNNILTVISGNLEFLEMQLKDEDQRELLSDAIEATQMGATLTDRLLTFARRRHLQPETVNLNNVVLHLTEMLKRTLGGQIDLSTVVSPELWSTRVDPGQVENAIMNLVINARDAMPDGGRVVVETKNTTLDQDYAAIDPGLETGDFVLLTVTDTGEGMPREVSERVFEPFFTTKEVGRGTGLGLSMVYGFAKQAQGHATIYSEVGVGTTINIYLPAIRKTTASTTAEVDRSRALRGAGEKVLIVEDDPKVRVLSVRRVRELGYVVIEVDNGKSALDLLDEDREIELVFTDIVMPGGMSGYELAQELRKTRPDIKVLLTSGYAEELVHPEVLAKNDLKVLRKPYRREELAQALHAAIQGK